MKISYNWLKDYLETSLSPEEIGNILTKTGLEVEGIDKIESVPGGLKGIVIGHVTEKSKHPNADKLSITKIDLGDGVPLQIVCGAPNVEKGQKVVVAKVGAELHPVSGASFKIKKGKIRGEVSEGMICAEDEIGLGASHDGIMVLDSNAVAGTPANAYFEIEDDYCIEIGLTPNRTDAMCHIGVARDLVAALKNMEVITNDPDITLNIPDVSSFQTGSKKCPIRLDIRDETACPRYTGIHITNVKVEPSPDWLINRLRAAGLVPINNIVDITNYVMHETGQPQHAFDADKIAGDTVIVTTLPAKTSFTTLDDVQRSLNVSDLIICNGYADSNPKDAGMCIAGVFGGNNSGITEQTASVFLESACFDPVSVRKTAKSHGLNTDASFRFERGVDANGTLYALKRTALLIQSLAGGNLESEIVDFYPHKVEKTSVSFNFDRLTKIAGLPFDEAHILNILEDLEIEVENKQGASWTLKIPVYRMDVTREADVIEEILRIHGYDAIPIPEKLNASLAFKEKPDREVAQNKIADHLVSLGYMEMMSNSLTKGSYLPIFEKIVPAEHWVEMLNPLSQDLSVLRPLLMPSVLEAVHLNQNQRLGNLRLFEFGSTYRKKNGGYLETERLVIALKGRKTEESWNNSAGSLDFFDLKATLEGILQQMNIHGVIQKGISNSLISEGMEWVVGGNPIAELGWVNPSLLKTFDIEGDLLIADVNWELSIKHAHAQTLKYTPLAKYPETRRDLSLLFDEKVSYAQIEKLAFEQDKGILRKVNLFDVYEGKEIPKGKKSYALSFVFRDENKTLRDKHVDKVMLKIQTVLAEILGGELR